MLRSTKDVILILMNLLLFKISCQLIGKVSCMPTLILINNVMFDAFHTRISDIVDVHTVGHIFPCNSEYYYTKFKLYKNKINHLSKVSKNN